MRHVTYKVPFLSDKCQLFVDNFHLFHWLFVLITSKKHLVFIDFQLRMIFNDDVAFFLFISTAKQNNSFISANFPNLLSVV